jgi:hypothetical protein
MPKTTSKPLGYEPDPILARQQMLDLIRALNRTRITTHEVMRPNDRRTIQLNLSEMQIELRRLIELWISSGPNVRKMFKKEPALAIRAQKGKMVFYALSGGRGCLEWIPIPPKATMLSPQDQALEYFMTLITNPLWEMLGGPCRCCKDFYLKKTNRRRVYCSRKCSSVATAVPSVSRRRQMVQANRIRCAQDAIAEWSKAKRRLTWKDWVSNRTGYNVKWITRAVTNGSLRPPAEDR